MYTSYQIIPCPCSWLRLVEVGSKCGTVMGFSGVSDGKESACNAGDPGSIPGSGRYPGEGNGLLVGYRPWVTMSRARLSD